MTKGLLAWLSMEDNESKNLRSEVYRWSSLLQITRYLPLDKCEVIKQLAETDHILCLRVYNHSNAKRTYSRKINSKVWFNLQFPLRLLFWRNFVATAKANHGRWVFSLTSYTVEPRGSRNRSWRRHTGESSYQELENKLTKGDNNLLIYKVRCRSFENFSKQYKMLLSFDFGAIIVLRQTLIEDHLVAPQCESV